MHLQCLAAACISTCMENKILPRSLLFWTDRRSPKCKSRLLFALVVKNKEKNYTSESSHGSFSYCCCAQGQTQAENNKMKIVRSLPSGSSDQGPLNAVSLSVKTEGKLQLALPAHADGCCLPRPLPSLLHFRMYGMRVSYGWTGQGTTILTPSFNVTVSLGWVRKWGRLTKGRKMEGVLIAQEGLPAAQHIPMKVVLPSYRFW